MCVAAFFWSPKNSPFRDHQNSLTDMSVRCDSRKHRNYPILTDIVFFFARQDAKKGPRSTTALDLYVFFKGQDSFKGCQLTIQSAFEYADSAFSLQSTFFSEFRPVDITHQHFTHNQHAAHTFTAVFSTSVVVSVCVRTSSSGHAVLHRPHVHRWLKKKNRFTW